MLCEAETLGLVYLCFLAAFSSGRHPVGAPEALLSAHPVARQSDDVHRNPSASQLGTSPGPGDVALCQKPAGLQPAHTWVLCSRGSGWTQAYHLVMTMLITSVEGVRVPEGR